MRLMGGEGQQSVCVEQVCSWWQNETQHSSNNPPVGNYQVLILWGTKRNTHTLELLEITECRTAASALLTSPSTPEKQTDREKRSTERREEQTAETHNTPATCLSLVDVHVGENEREMPCFPSRPKTITSQSTKLYTSTHNTPNSTTKHPTTIT